MINRASIIQWSKQVPWNDNAQIEQDLIISRALVAIFSDEFLSSQLAFRGGTALHKLYLSPQPRYSEDIDLVQINPGPIKPIMFRLGEVLDFLPNRVTKQKRYNNTMLFRMESEFPPTIQIRLKIEINCFEHFNELGLVKIPLFEALTPFVTDTAQRAPFARALVDKSGTYKLRNDFRNHKLMEETLKEELKRSSIN